ALRPRPGQRRSRCRARHLAHESSAQRPVRSVALVSRHGVIRHAEHSTQDPRAGHIAGAREAAGGDRRGLAGECDRAPGDAAGVIGLAWSLAGLATLFALVLAVLWLRSAR